MTIIHDPVGNNEARSRAFFLLVGASAALIYYAAVALLYETIGADYRIAVSIGYIVSVLFHFFANRHVTFRAGGGKLVDQAPRYFALVFVNYLLTLVIVTTAVEALGLSPYLAVAIAIVITLVVSYLLMRYWIFAKAR